MPLTTIKAGAPGTFAYARVFNSDGTLNRSFKITAQEYAALALPGAGAPPGVTKEEWENGLADAWGLGLEVGEYRVASDGALTIKIAQDLTGGKVEEVVLKLAKDEYIGTPPKITVDAGILQKIDTSKTMLTAIDAIVDGEVQWR